MGLVAIAIQNLPAIIDSLRGMFQRTNPSAPLPTDEEVISAYLQALASSLAKDAAWLAAHPKQADVRGSDDT